MSEPITHQKSANEVIIATIGNQKNPAQVVEIVHLPNGGVFITRGIATHFNIKDIMVPQALMLTNLQVMTQVVSYLLERIATAADLNLPFMYEPEFKLNDHKYTLKESGEYMLLTRNE